MPLLDYRDQRDGYVQRGMMVPPCFAGLLLQRRLRRGAAPL